jgi:hypothetical protein
MTVSITLTTAGAQTGPFNLYSNVTAYSSAFETNVSKLDLESGYISALAPDGTTIIRVMSNGDCKNYIDIPLIRGLRNGWVFFSDMNWLVNVNNPDNILACQKLFENFFGGVKDLACAKYVNELVPVFREDGYVYGVYYPGATTDTGYPQIEFCPILHAALDPLGYTFTGYDITQPGAGATINKPFVMHLYSYNDYTRVFTPTVIANLQQIAANHPVIVFGEWSIWSEYDDYIIQNVMGYLSSELRYSTNNSGAYGVPNPANLLGQTLIDSGVTKFVYNATGEFIGTLAEEFAFAKTNNTNQPSMLAISYRPDFL